jgi:hypothetical protein
VSARRSLRSFWLETQECLVPAKSADCKQLVGTRTVANWEVAVISTSLKADTIPSSKKYAVLMDRHIFKKASAAGGALRSAGSHRSRSGLGQSDLKHNRGPGMNHVGGARDQWSMREFRISTHGETHVTQVDPYQ